MRCHVRWPVWCSVVAPIQPRESGRIAVLGFAIDSSGAVRDFLAGLRGCVPCPSRSSRPSAMVAEAAQECLEAILRERVQLSRDAGP